ncbi:MAG: peroxidase family protein [Pseudomonadota bacterium]
MIYTVLLDQFVALRDGDRFWYENVLSGRALAEIRRTRLADIIRRNTQIGDEISDNVFQVGRRGQGPGRVRDL